jgi:hypothetical protein
MLVRAVIPGPAARRSPESITPVLAATVPSVIMDSGLGLSGRPGMTLNHPPAIAFQFADRCSAVRQASACAVRVGLWAPLVPITEAPRMPRFGTS